MTPMIAIVIFLINAGVVKATLTPNRRRDVDEARRICNNHCRCSLETENSNSLMFNPSPVQDDVTFFKINCQTFKQLKGLIEDGDKMPDPHYEVQLNVEADRQTNSKELLVTSKGDCSGAETQEVCIKYNEDRGKALDFVDILNIPCLPRHLGTEDDPFFVFFPNVTKFSFVSCDAGYSENRVDIFFIKQLHLKEVTVTTRSYSIHFHCAFGMECLNDELDLLSFTTVPGHAGAWIVAPEMKFPSIVKEFKYKPDARGAPDSLLSIFKDVTFENIALPYYPNLKPEHFEGAKISGGITFEIKIDQLDDGLDVLFQTGLMSKATVVVSDLYDTDLGRAPVQLPIASTTNQVYLSDRYKNPIAQALLSSDYEQVTLYGTVLVVRGFDFKLSEIKEIVVPKKEADDSINEINVYTFNLNIDITLDDFSRFDKLLLHYAYVQITNSGSRNGVYKIPVAPPGGRIRAPNVFNRDGEFVYAGDDVKYQFIHMNHARIPDPVFVTASAICLVTELDEYYSLYPGQSFKNDEYLLQWYEQFNQPVHFDQRYGNSLETRRARTLSRNLISYVALMENQVDGSVVRIPLLSLTVLEEQVGILARTGQYLADKKRHFEVMNKIDIVAETILDKLKKVLSEINQMKLDLLATSRMKSETLADIELRKQNDIEVSINQSNAFLGEVEKKYESAVENLKSKTDDFKAGVAMAVGFAVAEVAAEAIGAVLSIFSGGFNPSGMIKAAREVRKLKDIITKLAGVLSVISKLIKAGTSMNTVYIRFAMSVVKMKGIRKLKIGTWGVRMRTFWNVYTQSKSKINKVPANAEKWKRFKALHGRFKTPLGNGKNIIDSVVATGKAERTRRIGFDPETDELVPRMRRLLDDFVASDRIPTSNDNIVDTLCAMKDNNTIPESKKEAANILIEEYVTKVFTGDSGLGGNPEPTEEEILKGFQCNPSETQTLSTEGDKLGKAEVFKWRLAREHVIGMVDTTLSDDVPQATAYRAALLQFIEAGKTRTEEEINRAALQANMAMSKDIQCMYLEEALITEIKIQKVRRNIKAAEEAGPSERDVQSQIQKSRNEVKMNLDVDTFLLMFQALTLNMEFCNAYYYFHLAKCPDDVRIRISDTLDRIISSQTDLLYQSKLKLNDMYPPPQHFVNREIVINRKPNYCADCANKDYRTELNLPQPSDDDEELKRQQRDQIYEAVRRCFTADRTFDERTLVPAPDISALSTQEEQKVARYEAWNKVLTDCADDPIAKMKADSALSDIEIVEFSHDVSIDSEVFSGHDRVRVDDVQVILVGARTNNMIIEMYGETTGVSWDKYKGKCYRFIGDKWLRTMSYHTTTPYTNIDKAKVHQEFEGIYSSPTVFTTWTFSISKLRNPGLRMSNFHKIKLRFSGSFVRADPKLERTCELTDEDAYTTPPPPEPSRTSSPTQRAKAKKKRRKTKKNKSSSSKEKDTR